MTKHRNMDDHVYARRARSGEPWVEILGEALGEITGKISAANVWRIVGKPRYRPRTQHDNFKLGRAMRKLGWRRTMQRFDGRPQSAYVRGNSRDEIRREIYVLQCPITGEFAVTHSTCPELDEYAAVPHLR
jgi:hypothetical protein